MKPDDSQHLPVLVAPAASVVNRSPGKDIASPSQTEIAAYVPESPVMAERTTGLLYPLNEQATHLRSPGRGNQEHGKKIGSEHAKSMLKLGFHEVTQALVALPDSTIRPIEEPGVFGNEHMPHIQEHSRESLSSREQNHDRSRAR